MHENCARPLSAFPLKPPGSEPRSVGNPHTQGPDLVERLLTESTHIGLIEFARDTWVLDCNDAMAHILGYDGHRDLRGCHASELFAEADEFIRGVGALLAGDTLQREIRMRTRDGSLIWVVAHALCRPDDLGNPCKILATFLYLSHCQMTLSLTDSREGTS